MVKTFHVSVTGERHKRQKKECQDYAWSGQNDGCSIAIVCDGHGGADYVRSSVGAKLACRAAAENILSFLDAMVPEIMQADADGLLNDLERSIVYRWNELVKEHHSLHPLKEEELQSVSDAVKKKYLDQKCIEEAYGTTLIAAVMTEEYWFGIQIGDGTCVVLDKKGRWKQPIPWDERCILNQTTSLCAEDAGYCFRHYYSERIPEAVFLGTDGVDTSFENEEKLYDFYQLVRNSVISMELSKALTELSGFLPRLSTRGSGDDISISAIVRSKDETVS
ncbi:MAG: PP2C family serine/threonine-protein phosphatase [Lachnospiraceae bacterium]